MQCQQRQSLRARPTQARQTIVPKALWGSKSSTAVAEKPAKKTTSSKKTISSKSSTEAPRKKESFISQTISAFDFAETRSKKDADLLYEAKYGERGPDGKMTREQYQALRRKIGGTSRDFFKTWIEEEQVKTIKPRYNPEDAYGSVPFLPFLVGVVVAMLAATVVVVSKTGA